MLCVGLGFQRFGYCPGYAELAPISSLKPVNCACLPNSVFTDWILVALNWPQGKCSYHEKGQMLQVRIFFLISLPEFHEFSPCPHKVSSSWSRSEGKLLWPWCQVWKIEANCYGSWKWGCPFYLQDMKDSYKWGTTWMLREKKNLVKLERWEERGRTGLLAEAVVWANVLSSGHMFVPLGSVRMSVWLEHKMEAGCVQKMRLGGHQWKALSAKC